MNYRCNYMQVFKTYKYIVKTYMYTISALYTVKKIKSWDNLKFLRQPASADFLSSLNLFLYKLKTTSLNKNKKSAEAGFLKIWCWLNCFFFTVY